MTAEYSVKKNSNNQHWVVRDDYLKFISSGAIKQNRSIIVHILL
jgi:hypothetical protein